MKSLGDNGNIILNIFDKEIISMSASFVNLTKTFCSPLVKATINPNVPSCRGTINRQCAIAANSTFLHTPGGPASIFLAECGVNTTRENDSTYHLALQICCRILDFLGIGTYDNDTMTFYFANSSACAVRTTTTTTPSTSREIYTINDYRNATFIQNFNSNESFWGSVDGYITIALISAFILFTAIFMFYCQSIRTATQLERATRPLPPAPPATADEVARSLLRIQRAQPLNFVDNQEPSVYDSISFATETDVDAVENHYDTALQPEQESEIELFKNEYDLARNGYDKARNYIMEMPE